MCLFNDGKGAFKNITRRLPAQLPELPEICVYACRSVSVCVGWGGGEWGEGGRIRSQTLRLVSHLALSMRVFEGKNLRKAS